MPSTPENELSPGSPPGTLRHRQRNEGRRVYETETTENAIGYAYANANATKIQMHDLNYAYVRGYEFVLAKRSDKTVV